MFVGHFGMHMPVNMRILAIPCKFMDMLMMNIVRMGMDMIKRFMKVLVLVVLGQVNPNTNSHQSSRQPKQAACCFAQ